MKKTVYTLNVDNYSPEITRMTYPLLKLYARKIGADFHVINQRKFKGWPVVYEKLQIYELAKFHKNDWNIYIDSDALVHPETIDFTSFMHKDTIAHNGTDMANIRWNYDKYFWRDGRNLGSCNWFTVASDWCVDLWTPLDISFEEALKNIFPTVNEINTVVTPDHLIDDYTLSRNIARFGLKLKTLKSIQDEVIPESNFFWHLYTLPIDEKIKQMQGMIEQWKLEKYIK